MRSVDPRVRARRRVVLVGVLGLALTGSVAGWALRELAPVVRPGAPGTARDPGVSSTGSRDSQGSGPETSSLREFEGPSPRPLDPFDVKLWNPEPEAMAEKPRTGDSVPPSPRPREKPLRLQLVGITWDQSSRIAAIYDQDADALLLRGRGQTIRGYRVARVSADSVELQRGPRRTRIQMERSDQ